MIKHLLKKIIALSLGVVIVGNGISTYGNTQPKITANVNDEVKVVTELENQRTENSNTYLLSDGSKQIEIFTEDIRYECDGEFVEYDTAIGELTNTDKGVLTSNTNEKVGDYSFVNISGDSKHFFPKKLKEDTGVIMNNNEYVLSFAPITGSVEYVPEVKDDFVTYCSSGSDIKYQYISKKNGVKENIILPSRPTSNEFRFKVNTKNIKLQLMENGGINLIDNKTDKIVGCIEPPNIIDGDGNVSYEDIKYSLEENAENQEILKLTVNENFFENTNLKYPITIDPTALWFSDRLSLVAVSNVSYLANMSIPASDVYVSKAGTTEQRVYLNTGNVMSGNAFVGNPADISGKYIKEATLCLTEKESSYEVGTVEIKKPKTSWYSNNVTWNNQPELEEEIVGSFSYTGIEETAHYVDLTDWAQKLADGEIEDTGLVFTAKEEGTGAVLYGPGIENRVIIDNNTQKALYMSLKITYRDVNISDEDLIEYNYDTQTEKIYNYEYDSTLNNIYEIGYEPISLIPTSNQIQPFSIYPGDVLEEANTDEYPYKAIVRLRSTFQSEEDNKFYWSYGTGFVIGPNTIATAAHCMIGGVDKWKYDTKIYIGDINNESEYNVKSVICPKKYYDSSNGEYDWAILTVDENIGSETGWLGFGIIDDEMIGKEITVAGYTTVDSDTGTKLYAKDGEIYNISERKIGYYISTNSGQSGGPVFDENNIAWGIHVHGFGSNADYYNSATKINPCLFSLLKEKKNQGIETYN